MEHSDDAPDVGYDLGRQVKMNLLFIPALIGMHSGSYGPLTLLGKPGITLNKLVKPLGRNSPGTHSVWGVVESRNSNETRSQGGDAKTSNWHIII